MRCPLWLGMAILFLLPILATETIRGLTASPREARSTVDQAIVQDHQSSEPEDCSPTAAQPRRSSSRSAGTGMNPAARCAAINPADGRRGDRSSGLPPSGDASGLVESLNRLDGTLKRHKVVEGLLPGGPQPPPAGGLVGSLNNLGRVVEREVLPLLKKLSADP